MFVLTLLVCFISISKTSLTSPWQCNTDADCSLWQDRVCQQGDCVCPAGQQPHGVGCVSMAPYHTSTCVEDHQCFRMGAFSECSKESSYSETGLCLCQPNYHYYLGYCWPTRSFGQTCTRNEECVSEMGDVFSLACEEQSCQCAEGFRLRQRGDCRKIGNAPGDGCVQDQDCQFTDGVCDPATLRCYDSSIETRANKATLISPPSTTNTTNVTQSSSTRNQQYGQFCSVTNPCADSLECVWGTCVCPRGFYAIEDGSACYAELGTPSTPEQCFGLFTEVRDGICTCLANFKSDSNMRDCIKAARSLTDSCSLDAHCFTFGPASRCGEPQQWGLRTCECIPELSVWDEEQQMCRLFAGVGEECEVDSDCLAGELQIQCIVTDGRGVCTCPEGYVEVNGLCLTTGLSLGDPCQATVECTETANTVCETGRCACDSSGYMEVDGVCLPLIGGVCAENADCVIENTQCVASDNGTVSRCECVDGYVGFDNECWTLPSGYQSPCDVNAQCEAMIGDQAICRNNTCQCADSYHFRDGGCWPVTGLFQTCSRTSQCYLADGTERTVCRNSLCQCDFDYPYDEKTNTCLSSAASIVGSLVLIKLSLIILYFRT